MSTCAARDSKNNECVLDAGHDGRHLRQRPPGHHCHAVGCDVKVPPEMLMCRKHWFMVPKALRDAVWTTYRPGQCDDMNPSAAWHIAADAAICAVACKEGLPHKHVMEIRQL